MAKKRKRKKNLSTGAWVAIALGIGIGVPVVVLGAVAIYTVKKGKELAEDFQDDWPRPGIPIPMPTPFDPLTPTSPFS